MKKCSKHPNTRYIAIVESPGHGYDIDLYCAECHAGVNETPGELLETIRVEYVHVYMN